MSGAADFIALVRAGERSERAGAIDEAIAFYEQAAAANPGHGWPFTRRATLMFRRAFGPPPAPRAARPGVARIAMTSLGLRGRFGNQLLQYAFLRLYALRHGLEAEAPDWIGRDLFELDDPYPGASYPVVKEEENDFMASLEGESGKAWRNADLFGFCVYPTGRLRAHRERFASLFRPGKKLAPAAAAALEGLRARGETLVALHLRRGDFGSGRFWIAPAAWYLEWLDSIWATLRRPVLYVASDDAAQVDPFRRYAPLSQQDLGFAVPGAEFYPDFHVLANADAVATSNSTFSFVACMLNGVAGRCLRPDRGRARLVPFDPWDAPVVL